MRRNSPVGSQTVHHNLARVLGAGQVRREGNGGALPDNNGSAIARKIAQTIAYMREHLDQPLQVANLAAVANVSPSYYFALFKRWTGCAPMAYFTHLRMQRACHLLDATSASIKGLPPRWATTTPFTFPVCSSWSIASPPADTGPCSNIMGCTQKPSRPAT